jgi:sulfoxide reductase heme-binding subunit YedZ
MPWLDRSGRWSPLKTAVFVALFLPGAWTLAALLGGAFGTRPAMDVNHELGDWAIRLLFLSLAITPLRQALDWPRLVLVRRMVGVAAFAYLLVHLLAYVVDQRYDVLKVASEIALRIYLTIGFAALIILAALAATSTDAMLRRVGGRNWRRLHRYAYAAAILGSVHFFMQSKFTVTEPLWMSGLLAWMLGWRVAAAFPVTARAPVAVLFALALLAGAAAAGGEAVYVWFKIGADPVRVLATNFSLDAGLRPGCVAFAVALAIALAAMVRRRFTATPRPRLQAA